MIRRDVSTFLMCVGVLLGSAVMACRGNDAFAVNAALRRGVNLGNMLEAPHEGDWGVRVEDEYFTIIHDAGFDAVRIPIRWSAHAAPDPPCTIDESFFQRVDHVIQQALDNDLHVIINVHHYEEICARPAAHRDRLIALWRQIARRYREQPEQVCFEVLNEPHGALTARAWNGILTETLAAIRESNPQRIVVLGPTSWNNYSHLDELELPEDDRNIIVTFHFYDPFEFTHQGALWVQPKPPPVGRRWEGTDAERRQIEEAFNQVADWSREHQRPVFLGEFGAFEQADIESRIRWTRFIREQAEQRGFSWSYWEFGSGFGVYDPIAKEWRTGLREALVGQ